DHVAAYLTGTNFPVCQSCLPAVCEEMEWDRNSQILKQVRVRGLKAFHVRGDEELEWDLSRSLTFLPSLLEREIYAAPELLERLGLLFEKSRVRILDA
ncbi:MAG: hypothetical protein ACE5KO_01135, partial [Candidatus Bathyarchaeia archaeon]